MQVLARIQTTELHTLLVLVLTDKRTTAKPHTLMCKCCMSSTTRNHTLLVLVPTNKNNSTELHTLLVLELTIIQI